MRTVLLGSLHFMLMGISILLFHIAIVIHVDLDSDSYTASLFVCDDVVVVEKFERAEDKRE